MNKILKRSIFSKSTTGDPTNPLDVFKHRVQHMEIITKPEEILRTYNSIQGLRIGFKHADDNLKTLTEGTIKYLNTKPVTANHLMHLVKDSANLGICDPFLWQSYKEKFDVLLKTENLNKTTFLRTCLYFDKYCPIALSMINFELQSYDGLFNQIKGFLKANNGAQYIEDCLMYDSLTSTDTRLTNPKTLDIHFRSHSFNIDRNVMAVYLRVLAESDGLNSRDNRIASYNLCLLLLQQLDKDLATHLDVNVYDTEFERYTEYTWRSIANAIRFMTLNSDIPADDIKSLEKYLFEKQEHHLIDFKSFIDIIQTIADNSEAFKSISFNIVTDLCNMIWHQVENESVMFTTQSEHDLLVLIQSVNILIEEEVLNKNVLFRLYKIVNATVALYKDGSFVRNGFSEYVNNEIGEFEKFQLKET